jgi:hypothetical protein
MGFCGKRAGSATRTKTRHAKKATGKKSPRKPIRFGSQNRFHPSRPFLQLRLIKEKQEI